MKKDYNFAFRLLTACLILCWFFGAITPAQDLEQAPPLPAGMTGSKTDEPRFQLSPGLYDAGEAAFGMKHLPRFMLAGRHRGVTARRDELNPNTPQPQHPQQADPD